MHLRYPGLSLGVCIPPTHKISPPSGDFGNGQKGFHFLFTAMIRELLKSIIEQSFPPIQYILSGGTLKMPQSESVLQDLSGVLLLKNLFNGNKKPRK